MLEKRLKDRRDALSQLRVADLAVWPDGLTGHGHALAGRLDDVGADGAAPR